MPTTLYSTSNAFPILTEYSTRSFDSGLLLWQGTYMTDDTSAPPFAEGDPIPDGDYGAIDGLFVHPAPVLKKSPGPLAEWTVTAYGRTNTQGKARKNLLAGIYTFTEQGLDNDGNFFSNQFQNRALNEVVVVSRVVPINEPIGALTSPMPLKSYRYPESGQDLAQWLQSQGYTVTQNQNLARFDSNNFGAFLEITYSVTAYISGLKTV